MSMSNIQKDAVAYGTGFGMMVATSTVAYALPVPLLKELLTAHFTAVVVWTVCTSVGWLVSFYIRKKLK